MIDVIVVKLEDEEREVVVAKSAITCVSDTYRTINGKLALSEEFCRIYFIGGPPDGLVVAERSYTLREDVWPSPEWDDPK